MVNQPPKTPAAGCFSRISKPRRCNCVPGFKPILMQSKTALRRLLSEPWRLSPMVTSGRLARITAGRWLRIKALCASKSCKRCGLGGGNNDPERGADFFPVAELAKSFGRGANVGENRLPLPLQSNVDLPSRTAIIIRLSRAICERPTHASSTNFSI